MHKLMRLAMREAETAYALAIGFLINGLVGVAAAQAGVLSPDTVIKSYAFAGALGGLTMALIHFVGIAFADEQHDRRKSAKAGAEGVCAIIVGSIVAAYFTPYAGRWVPRVDPADLLWLGYAIGVFAWRAMPLFIEQLPKVIAGLGDAIVAGLRRMIGGTA
jgi:hypothetical protein